MTQFKLVFPRNEDLRCVVLVLTFIMFPFLENKGITEHVKS